MNLDEVDNRHVELLEEGISERTALIKKNAPKHPTAPSITDKAPAVKVSS